MANKMRLLKQTQILQQCWQRQPNLKNKVSVRKLISQVNKDHLCKMTPTIEFWKLKLRANSYDWCALLIIKESQIKRWWWCFAPTHFSLKIEEYRLAPKEPEFRKWVCRLPLTMGTHTKHASFSGLEPLEQRGTKIQYIKWEIQNEHKVHVMNLLIFQKG